MMGIRYSWVCVLSVNGLRSHTDISFGYARSELIVYLYIYCPMLRGEWHSQAVPAMATPYIQTHVKSKRKTRSEDRDIDENNIAQWIRETFGIFGG